MKIFVVIWTDLSGKKTELATFKDFYVARAWAWEHELLGLRVEEREV